MARKHRAAAAAVVALLVVSAQPSFGIWRLLKELSGPGEFWGFDLGYSQSWVEIQIPPGKRAEVTDADRKMLKVIFDVDVEKAPDSRCYLGGCSGSRLLSDEQLRAYLSSLGLKKTEGDAISALVRFLGEAAPRVGEQASRTAESKQSDLDHVLDVLAEARRRLDEEAIELQQQSFGDDSEGRFDRTTFRDWCLGGGARSSTGAQTRDGDATAECKAFVVETFNEVSTFGINRALRKARAIFSKLQPPIFGADNTPAPRFQQMHEATKGRNPFLNYSLGVCWTSDSGLEYPPGVDNGPTAWWLTFAIAPELRFGSPYGSSYFVNAGYAVHYITGADFDVYNDGPRFRAGVRPGRLGGLVVGVELNWFRRPFRGEDFGGNPGELTGDDPNIGFFVGWDLTRRGKERRKRAREFGRLMD